MKCHNHYKSNNSAGHITATDADSDEKTQIEYTLVSPDPLPFKLDAKTGESLKFPRSILWNNFLGI